VLPPLHPRRGPHHPASGTPLRRRGSVRRTTTHDSLRPEGILGPVHLEARGRDLRTEGTSSGTVLATAALDIAIDFVNERTVTAIRVDPPVAGIDGVVGISASSGFRQAVDEALPGERTTGSLRYQLLDDVPTATLVGGYALGAAGARHLAGRRLAVTNENLCAGWVTGGTIMLGLLGEGHPPVVTGPDAPPLTRDDDPLAWHDLPALPPHGMRRWRRIDVWPDGGEIACDAFFRDSHMDGDGRETVIHEYSVRAALDAAGKRFTRCEASVGALPWLECPGAASSASRLVGAPADGLRQWVRETFLGPPTCTHLNDTLRALEDVPALVGALRRDMA